MHQRLKTLGTLAVAAAALSAIAASTALAGGFDIGAQPAVIKGESEAGQNHVLTITTTAGGNVVAKCPAASLEGTSVGQSISEATVTPTYGPGCQFAGISSQVLTNGCKFTITGSGQPANTMLVDIVGCTTGKQIETKTITCTFHIPEQNGLSHVVASNIGNNEVTLNATLQSITYTQTGAGCPDGNNHVASAGTITGNTIIKAFQDLGSEQATFNGHQYNKLKAGTQVSLAST